ncbi:MerR family transcriptional regulator [Leptospira sp. WS92.C1]
MTYKIKEVADIAGVSVRTLHHYDHIDLLKPTFVNQVGYRFYTDKDLEQLQQILFFKELGFSLEETKEILSRSDFDRKQSLMAQKKLLITKLTRLRAQIDTLEKTLLTLEGKTKMDKKTMFEGFDFEEIEKHKEKYSEETKQKYGNTNSYLESQSKTSRYSKEDWAKIKMRGDAIYAKIGMLMDKKPDDSQVQIEIENWRQHITDNFYNCTPDIFRGLGDLYVNDERFSKNIDKVKPGLSQFLRKAMHSYCDRLT